MSRRQAPVIEVVDITPEKAARIDSTKMDLERAGALILAKAKRDGAPAEILAVMKAQLDLWREHLALQQRRALAERMMHAAKTVRGWDTLEQIEACVKAANEGDPEAIRTIQEMVELVEHRKNRVDDPD